MASFPKDPTQLVKEEENEDEEEEEVTIHLGGGDPYKSIHHG